MSIINSIAWRNVGRNPRRTAVVAGAVAFGVFAFIGSTAFMDGIGMDLINAAVDVQGGHVQIARDGYHGNPTIDSRFGDVEEVLAVVAGWPGAHAAPQVLTPGMANSSEQSAGIVVNGVDPVLERSVTIISDRIVEGQWLDPDGDRLQVVVGQGLAERLRVRLGEKIVLMASDVDNEVSAGAFRIAGIFRTASTTFDKTSVYVLIDEAAVLLGFEGEISTVAVRLVDPGESDAAARAISADLEGRGFEVLTWKERNPLLEMTKQAYDYSVVLTAIILFVAVGFTLANSFLMVIFERIHEIGIMIAQGVKPRVIRSMLFREAFIVASLGSAVGVAASAVLLGFWMNRGLDLSDFADGLGAFGVDTVIYPYLDWTHMAGGFVIIIIMIGLSVLYPAVKASRFHAVEAINHV